MSGELVQSSGELGQSRPLWAPAPMLRLRRVGLQAALGVVGPRWPLDLPNPLSGMWPTLRP